MKKIHLGQSVQIIANLGVIAGIIFLAIEIHQNNQLMRSQVRSDIANGITSNLLGLAHSDHLEDIRDSAEIEDAGGLPAFRQQLYEIANLRGWENIHYQWRNGLYDDAEFEAETQYWAISINRPWRREAFCQNAAILSPEFRADIEALLDRPCE